MLPKRRRNNRSQNLNDLHKRSEEQSKDMLRMLQETALKNENTFDALMEATKYCSLGQITHAMFEVGGQYRRNM